MDCLTRHREVAGALRILTRFSIAKMRSMLPLPQFTAEGRYTLFPELPYVTSIGAPFRTRLKRSITSWLIMRTQPLETARPMLSISIEPCTR